MSADTRVLDFGFLSLVLTNGKRLCLDFEEIEAFYETEYGTGKTKKPCICIVSNGNEDGYLVTNTLEDIFQQLSSMCSESEE